MLKQITAGAVFFALLALMSSFVVGLPPGEHNICCSASDVSPPGSDTCAWITVPDACAIGEPMGNAPPCAPWVTIHNIAAFTIYTAYTPGTWGGSWSNCISGCYDPTPDGCIASYGPVCVDFMTDSRNCGDCNYVCESGTCVEGRCKGGVVTIERIFCRDNDYDINQNYFISSPSGKIHPPDLLVNSSVRHQIDDLSWHIKADTCTSAYVVEENYCEDQGPTDYFQFGALIGNGIEWGHAEFDCRNVNSLGIYDPAVTTDGVCLNDRCQCPPGEVWLTNTECGVPCDAVLNPVGKRVKGMVGASRKFEIDNAGKAYFDGTIIKDTAEIDQHGGMIIQNQVTPIAAFDKYGNLRLRSDGAVFNDYSGIVPLGPFQVVNNGEVKFSIAKDFITGKWNAYSKSCIHQADNVGSIGVGEQ